MQEPHPTPDRHLSTDGVDPSGERDRREGPGRAAVYVAAALVAIIAGSGLFVSGFALGQLQGTTAGTGESRQELFQPFWDAYNDITHSYVGEIDERRLVEGAIQGVFQALGDPFSGYMTSDEYRGSLSHLSGEFEGIGAEMATREPDGNACTTITHSCRLTVTRVLRRSPALAAGLQVDDVILAVDGRSTLDSSLDVVIPLIRGTKGTSVTLSIDRAGDPLELRIVRDVIQSEHVRSDVLADGAIGYLKVENFSSGAAQDLHDLLRELVEEHRVRALILDLRDDPGGYVDAARRIASEFVATSPLYWEQGARSEPLAIEPIPGGAATDPSIPLVVLVNGGTASASEIVAGSLQGSGRAQLVGQRTYGKGTIQEWKELEGAGGYRLSVRKWLTPDQTWIHGEGLTPDLVVEVPEGTPAGQDPVLDQAIELLRAALEEAEHPLHRLARAA
ncbi:MAG TPA: S41 family peptidase [Candidatus Limnocylindrales bacterium]|nr:S41 family peptidase [Candidatus Limnocylindrales bacterium]